MTEKEMQLMLGKHFGIQYICIPNVLMTGEYKKDILPEVEKLKPWERPSKMYEADFMLKNKIVTTDEKTGLSVVITLNKGELNG